MARFTLLLTILALALPGVALASPRDSGARVRSALATERYYESYGRAPVSATTAAPVPAASGHDGPSWAAAAAVGGALIVLAAGLGLYGGRAVRPRHPGAQGGARGRAGRPPAPPVCPRRPPPPRAGEPPGARPAEAGR